MTHDRLPAIDQATSPASSGKHSCPRSSRGAGGLIELKLTAGDAQSGESRRIGEDPAGLNPHRAGGQRPRAFVRAGLRLGRGEQPGGPGNGWERQALAHGQEPGGFEREKARELSGPVHERSKDRRRPLRWNLERRAERNLVANDPQPRARLTQRLGARAYRVCFRWTSAGAEDVEIVDYH